MRAMKDQWSMKFKGLKLYLAIIIVTLILILYTSGQVYIVTLEKNIIESRKEHAILKTQIDNLTIEVASLRKGSRIIKFAQVYLDMNVPEGAPKKLF